MLKMNLLVKTVGLIAATTLATVNFADEVEQPLQLAQLTDGFNAETTYMASCFACHSTGAAGAPKVGAGNAAVWEAQLEKGMDAVVGNAISGVNSMPAKGLCFTCTDEDIRAVVEYMVASSK